MVGQGVHRMDQCREARPLFPGHYQPHVPADLGFYDLRLPETREDQPGWPASMASRHSATTTTGSRESAFSSVRSTKCWRQAGLIFRSACAGRIRVGRASAWGARQTAGEQTYPGSEDYRRHFDFLLPAFMDRRYVRVGGKPMFVSTTRTSCRNQCRLPICGEILRFERGCRGSISSPSTRRGIGIRVRRVRCRRERAPAAQAQGAAGLGHVEASAAEAALPGGRLAPASNHSSLRRCDRALIVARVPGIESFPCVIPNWDNTRAARQWNGAAGSTPSSFETPPHGSAADGRRAARTPIRVS